MKVKMNKGDNMINFADLQPGTYKRLGEDSYFLLEKDDEGKISFVVELPKDIKFFAKTLKLVGISVKERTKVAETQFVLTLKSEDDLDIFVKLCNDLQEVKVSDNLQKYADDLSFRLEQWVKFLAIARSKLIPIKTQLGLIGELSFLKLLLNTGVDPKVVLEKWRGPEGSAHDFVLSKSWYEVKGHVTEDKHVNISNEYQLDSDERIPLYLMVFDLGESDQGQNIVDMAKEIITTWFQEDAEAKAIFERKLLELKFNIMENYENLGRYEVVGTQKYEVRDKFPRIIPAKLPESIEYVKYELNLDGIADFVVDFKPESLKQEI